MLFHSALLSSSLRQITRSLMASKQKLLPKKRPNASHQQSFNKATPNKKRRILKESKLSSSPYENVSECPMCCRTLNGLSDSNRNVHVNLCIDLSMNANNKNRKKPQLNRLFSSTSEQSQSKKENYSQFKMLDEGSNIIIDGFMHSHFAPLGAIFFLTHFHSDHYRGITPKFSQGLIYCSEITAALLRSQIRVSSDIARPLPMYCRKYIEESNPRTFVTLLDANHCPGAAMFLFEVHDEEKNAIYHHLHVGDARCEFEENSLFFRKNFAFLQPYFGKIDKLFLDTTYCLTQTNLPRQRDAIRFIADKVDVDTMVIYEVPYSEHSSFAELCNFVNLIEPKQIIPTVHCSKAKQQIDILSKHRQKMKNYKYPKLQESDGGKQITLKNDGFFKKDSL